ncbi:MAG: hypothetical protein KU37_02110 [Sulfuricurvum sp. PC08-66]|nr:MAG: hypothetical protein KU37_02110 [Sulfuricurvum sp. PC08-66]
MIQAQAPQPTVKPTQAPTSKSSEASEGSVDFASVLAQSVAPKSIIPPKAKQPSPIEVAAGKHPTAPMGVSAKKESAIPDDFAEGAPENTPKLATLTQLLASISHESTAPQGTSVLNLKTVLGYNNDDPRLINADLVSLLPQKDQKAAAHSLIAGTKKLLHDRLEGYIPLDRIPKTLKGMVETALRLEIPVADIKVETLPQSAFTKQILEAFALNQARPALPQAKLDSSMLENGTTKTPEGQTQTSSLSKSSASTPALALQQALAQALPQKEKLPTGTPQAPTLKPNEAALPPLTDAQSSMQQNSNAFAQTSPEAQAIDTAVAAVAEQEAVAQDEESPHASQGTQKADAAQKYENNLEQKLADGRMMMRQLSENIKEAMENYKPPFTRLTMKLTPEHLGEIDVSIVSRGSNVHISLSSNPLALQMLQNQSAELKAALANVGLGDAAMNFSQQGNGQPKHDHPSTAQHYETMAQLEDEISMLELIVPQYG